MASNTTTSTLQFKSHKGGEKRAEFQGLLYSVKTKAADVFEALVRYPGDKQFTPLGGGSTFDEAALVAEMHATAPDSDDPDLPEGVNPGDDRHIAAVLASVPDPDLDEEIAQAVAQGVADDVDDEVAALVAETDSKAAKKAADKAKRAAKAAPAPHTPGTPLVFAPFRGDDDDQRAKGVKHAYRITHAMSGGFFAQQRTCSWTNIAGKCDTFDQAVDLANRYESGAKQLSHRAFQGLPYAKAIAKLDGEGK